MTTPDPRAWVAQLQLVYLESPFAAPAGTPAEDRAWHVEKHLAYARAAMADCLSRLEAPFVSHALYTQPGVLDDLIPHERALGIEAGFAWARAAVRTVVYCDLGISRGMHLGIKRAKAEGRPIHFRSCPAWKNPISVAARLHSPVP
jgi:hypothetical protein